MSLQFQIDDMTCGHCVRAITEAVQTLDGQSSVQADVKTHCVVIDSSVDGERIAQAIRDAGYTPQAV